MDIGPQMTLYRSVHEGKVLGSVAMPCRDNIAARTTMSLTYSDWTWAQPDAVSVNIVSGSVLTLQRNTLVQRMQGDWLLFIDDDMVWESDAIGRLVKSREEHDFDILGGLCFRRQPPHQPTLYMREQPTEGSYNIREDWAQDEIVEVDATGMAFCLIHRRVFEAMSGGAFPDDAATRRPPDFFTWGGGFGEDLRFCQDAKALGFRIFVDTSIEIGHASERVITKEDYYIELAKRSPIDAALRRHENDEMGLPTIMPAEAKRRLGW